MTTQEIHLIYSYNNRATHHTLAYFDAMAEKHIPTYDSPAQRWQQTDEIPHPPKWISHIF